MDSTLNPKISSITKKIRERRRHLNYTQQYLACRLNISQNAYSKIESGLTNFSVIRLYQIAEILQTDVKQFV